MTYFSEITSHQQQDKDTTHHIDDAIPNEGIFQQIHFF